MTQSKSLRLLKKMDCSRDKFISAERDSRVSVINLMRISMFLWPYFLPVGKEVLPSANTACTESADCSLVATVGQLDLSVLQLEFLASPATHKCDN